MTARVGHQADRDWLRRAGASLASGILVGAAFPPLDWGPLCLFALTPLLWAWRGQPVRRAASFAFLAGVAFFGVLLPWTWYFGAVALVPLVVFMAAFWALIGALVAVGERAGIRSPWTTAAIWVLVEAQRGRWPLGGFPWGGVGDALHDFAVARALASWGGVLLVTFLVVAWNDALVDVLLAARAPKVRYRRAWAGASLAFIVAVSTVGDLARFTPTRVGTLRFALLQGNDQNRRLTKREINHDYLQRRHFALAKRLRGDYDLIVFPESSLDENPLTNAATRRRLQEVARKHHAAVLANALTQTRDGRTQNTNLWYDNDGDYQGKYSKQHLVPFGEYVPWRSAVDWISALDAVPDDWVPGDRTTVFRVGRHRVGTVICFESAFSSLVRRFVEDGAQLIVVSTNNRSFRRSANSAQHVALSQMRAAETGRPVLQAAISGITAVIDASGNVQRTTKLFERTAVTGTVVLTTGTTPYVRYGEWILVAGVLLLLGASVLVVVRERRGARRTPAS